MANDKIEFVVFDGSDGDVYVSTHSRAGLEQKLNEEYWGSRTAASLSELLEQTQQRSRCGWDFSNTGPRCLLIFRLDALVTPEAVTQITRWKLP